ncbi:LOW QUALITY PROTEIN: inner centromere protein A-like [Erpetoichthys calabaricus]|uniref:LOW QUALITY PROTEIN: inner centromere protein A-like n=1 Tax=Erpetoichthys calabaricus TaxID=27687 RepID=UPI002234E693|nr:LOW QUALITY PROTEIN: inner centromere protein A-like [Erpetoichthys calabaricus]
MEELAKSNVSIMKMFEKKVQGFIGEVENNHMVWLQEIQEEAVKMFCRLSRTRTVRRSSVKVSSLNLINEELQKEPLKVEDLEHSKPFKATLNKNKASSVTKSCAKTMLEKKVVVEITLNDFLSAEIHQKNKDVHETIGNPEEMCPEDVSSDTERSTFKSAHKSHRPSGRRSIAGHRSLLSIRKSLTRESMRRASRRSVHKKAILESSTSSSRNSNGKAEHCADLLKSCKQAVAELNSQGEDCQAEQPVSPVKKPLPVVSVPKSHSVTVKPHMKSLLHTVQKNQLLMSTPNLLGRSTFVKSFIKRTTPLKVDIKEKERQFLEMLKKKEDQETEQKKKMEEEEKLKLEEVKRNRKELLKKVTEAREREEQKEEAKKRKIKQTFAQVEEKNDKLFLLRYVRNGLQRRKAKCKLTNKKVLEAEIHCKQEEDARRIKILQAEEEERKHQELLQKKREEEEQECLKKMAEVNRLKQVEQERQLAAEKELQRKREQKRIWIEWEEQLLLEKEKAVQMEIEKAAKEKALLEAAKEKESLQKEADEREKLRAKQQHKANLENELKENLKDEKLAKKKPDTSSSHNTLNITVDLEKSPQSYEMTPKGSNKTIARLDPENYGMDLNSDDSTDDESAPRKPIPSWAKGQKLNQAIMHHYYNPPDTDKRYDEIEPPNLVEIFNKSKPRYLKRTSSAEWDSPPMKSNLNNVSIKFTH